MNEDARFDCVEEEHDAEGPEHPADDAVDDFVRFPANVPVDLVEYRPVSISWAAGKSGHEPE